MRFGNLKMEARLIFVTFLGLIIFGLVKAESFTAEERAALNKFRPMVEDVLYLDWMKRDEYLIKWIRDRSFNLDKANQKLRKAMAWRKTNNIDGILNDPSLKEMEREIPFKINAKARDGTPILTFRLGQDWNIRRVALAGKMKTANRHLHGMLEKGYKAAREAGRNVTQWILIGSLINFNLREHACLACLPFYTDFVVNYEANFPETLKTMIPINTPKIFERISELVRPIMSPGTRKGWNPIGYDRKELQAHLTKLDIDLNQLETQYGGNLPNTVN